jgi:hypothetical protein
MAYNKCGGQGFTYGFATKNQTTSFVKIVNIDKTDWFWIQNSKMNLNKIDQIKTINRLVFLIY